VQKFQMSREKNKENKIKKMSKWNGSSNFRKFHLWTDDDDDGRTDDNYKLVGSGRESERYHSIYGGVIARKESVLGCTVLWSQGGPWREPPSVSFFWSALQKFYFGAQIDRLDKLSWEVRGVAADVEFVEKIEEMSLPGSAEAEIASSRPA
jgi:hypothetical protein